MDYTELTRQAKEAATSAAAHAQTAQEALSNARSISLVINNEKAVEINNCKEDIRQAIEVKGQSCPETTPFNEYAEKILSIVTGAGSNSSSLSPGETYVPGFDSDNGYSFIRRNTLSTGSWVNSFLIELYKKEDALISVSNKYKFKSFANSDYYSVAIGTDSNLYAWGRFSDANGSPIRLGDSFNPVLVDASGNWKQIWQDYNEFFVLNNNGELFSFGENEHQQIGTDKRNYRGLFKIANIDGCKWKKVAINECTSYFLTENGRLFSCGSNENGLRGIGDRSYGSDYELSEIYNIEGTTWTDVGAYYRNAYALTSTGEIYGWGRNNCYQLGYMNDNTGDFSTPNKISSDRIFKKISVGEGFMAAIDDSGALWSIGEGNMSRNGHGKTVNVLTRIGDKNDWKDLICFSKMIQAIDSDGKIYRCGNYTFRFGMGSDSEWSQPYMTYLGIKSKDCLLESQHYLLAKNFEIDTQLQAYLHSKASVIIIPDSVKKITSDFFNSKSDMMMMGNTYTRVYIPNTVEEIDDNAFRYTVGDSLCFQASKEEVQSMEGYPWGFNDSVSDYEDHMYFNCEFEHDEGVSDFAYFIENNFPDGYTLTVPASAVGDFSIAKLGIENIVLEGDYAPGMMITTFSNMPKLKNITINRNSPFTSDYLDGSLLYNCPSKITLNCGWVQGEYPVLEENFQYSLKTGDEVKYLIYLENENYSLSDTKIIDGSMTRRITVYKASDDSEPVDINSMLTPEYQSNDSIVVNLLDLDKKAIDNGTVLKKGIYYIDIKNTSNVTASCTLSDKMSNGFDKCFALVRNIVNQDDVSNVGFTFNASHQSDRVWYLFNSYQKYINDGGWFSGDIGVSASNPTWFSVENSDGFIPMCVYIKNEINSPQNFKNAKIQGKTESGSWVDLHEISNSPDTAALEQCIMFDNDTKYYGLRMYFTEAYNSGVSVQAFNVYYKRNDIEQETAAG